MQQPQTQKTPRAGRRVVLAMGLVRVAAPGALTGGGHRRGRADRRATTWPAFCTEATVFNVKKCVGFVTDGSAFVQALEQGT